MGRVRAWWATRSRRGKALTIVAIVVLLLIVGTAGGPPRPSTGGGSSTPPASVGVRPPASVGVATLGSPIPGLTAADVKLNVEERGLTCTGPDPLEDGITYTCSASSTDGNTQWQVELFGSDPTTIRSVIATVLWSGAGSADPAMDDFLGYIATLPYDGSTPEEARAWARANDAGERAFGAVTYSLTTAGTGRARILTMRGDQ